MGKLQKSILFCLPLFLFSIIWSSSVDAGNGFLQNNNATVQCGKPGGPACSGMNDGNTSNIYRPTPPARGGGTRTRGTSGATNQNGTVGPASSSTSPDVEVERQRAEQLRQQAEIERQKTEQMRLQRDGSQGPSATTGTQGAVEQTETKPEEVEEKDSTGGTCLADTSAAFADCNAENSNDLRSAQMKMQGFSAIANTFAQGQGCAQFGAVAQATNAAIGTYKAYCGSSYNKCKSSCAEELSAVESDPTLYSAGMKSKLQQATRECSSLEQYMYSVAQDAVQVLATQQQAKACIAATKGLNNINLIDFNEDCSKPGAATTSEFCKCQLNPALCSQAGGGDIYNGVQTGNMDQPSMNGDELGGFPGIYDESVNGFGNGPLGNAQEQEALSTYNGKPGNGGVGGGGGGTNAGGGQGNNRRGKGNSGFNTAINSGYYGGGSAAGGGAAGSNSPDRKLGGGSQDPARAGEKPVDLRAFLPGGRQDPRRGIAGISGPDGITGPHTNIWQKVNTRYFAITPTMRP